MDTETQRREVHSHRPEGVQKSLRKLDAPTRQVHAPAQHRLTAEQAEHHIQGAARTQRRVFSSWLERPPDSMMFNQRDPALGWAPTSSLRNLPGLCWAS